MSNKLATMLDVCSFELTYRILRPVDCHQRVLPVVLGFKRTVRLVPRFLQINERFREFPDFMRKSLHCLLVKAGISRASVFKRAVRQMPSRCVLPADEQVGGAGQRVEYRVIRRADRTAQVGLRGPPSIKPRQAAGSCYQVVRSQVSSCLALGRHDKLHWKSALRKLSLRLR